MNCGAYDPDKDHLHVYKNRNELLALNRDGTAHDRSHGVKIPSYVADKIRNDYPDFQLPDDSFIESLELEDPESQAEILLLLDQQEQYRNGILQENG